MMKVTNASFKKTNQIGCDTALTDTTNIPTFAKLYYPDQRNSNALAHFHTTAKSDTKTMFGETIATARPISNPLR